MKLLGSRQLHSLKAKELFDREGMDTFLYMVNRGTDQGGDGDEGDQRDDQADDTAGLENRRKT